MNRVGFLVFLSWNYFYSVELGLVFFFTVQSVLFLFTVLAIFWGVEKLRVTYIGNGCRMNSFFYGFLGLFILSIVVIVLSGALFFRFIGWDGLGVTSFFLVYFYINGRVSNKCLVVRVNNRVGDGLLLFFLTLRLLEGLSSTTTQQIGFLGGRLLVRFCLTKRAQYPFTSWLPFAIVAPTPVSTLVHSRTLVTAGVYILIVFFPVCGNGGWVHLDCLNRTLFAFGLLTLTLSRFLALLISDIKKVIALSTINHLRCMVVLVGLGLSDLAFFHLLAHAYFKSRLFLSFGLMIVCSNHGTDFRRVGFNMNYSGFVYTLMVVSIISINGVFFLSGFFAKEKLLVFGFRKTGSFVLGLLFWFVLLGSFFYSLRLLRLLSSNYTNSKVFYMSGMLSKRLWITFLTQRFLSVFIGLIIFLKVLGLGLVFRFYCFSELLFIVVISIFSIIMVNYSVSVANYHQVCQKLLGGFWFLDYRVLRFLKGLVKNRVFFRAESGIVGFYLQPVRHLWRICVFGGYLWWFRRLTLGGLLLLFLLLFLFL